MAAATHIDDLPHLSGDEPTASGPQRTCAVTREVRERLDLLRFVAGPDGAVVFDAKGNLPGRGVWLTPRRSVVEQAVKRKAFSRGLKQTVEAPSHLAEMVDDRLTDAALGALGFARKAGQCLTGAGKVESALRNATALAALHAEDGAEDGLRKLRQWVHSGLEVSEREAPVLRVFTASQMSLALGATHVIHAAIMQGGAGRNALKRISQLVVYRDAGSG
ncbi:MAG: RNA-binding protein [Pseudomonadota bacterium]